MGVTGCGGGGGDGSDPDEPSKPGISERMLPGQSYRVEHGDRIVKTSPIAHIHVSHVEGHAESWVILLDGNATIYHHP